MITFNGNPVPVTLFPDNTSQVWHLPAEILRTTNFAHIVWDFQHEGEFMQLAQLKVLLDGYGFKTCLRLPYLPYGRQDKVISNDATFGLHVFLELLDHLKFDEIICVDPHSDYSEKYFAEKGNFKSVYPTKELVKVIDQTKASFFCLPDKGAAVKYSKIYKDIIGELYVVGAKVRDQATGKILSYHIPGNPNLEDENILIIDDICDGGATFVLLADALIAQGAKEVNLFVSHGIFSKGLRPLFEAGIKHVFAKDGEAGEHQNIITYRRL